MFYAIFSGFFFFLYTPGVVARIDVDESELILHNIYPCKVILHLYADACMSCTVHNHESNNVLNSQKKKQWRSTSYQICFTNFKKHNR